ncbi:hypothetical protein [Trinickia sp. EG282A]|uniref:hypothetical protein n=1 Tax=Trinickia sp. EG282A TaxID=3237013 RepID=UPI0034D19DF7
MHKQNPTETNSLNKLIERLTNDPEITPESVIADQKVLEEEANSFSFEMGGVNINTNVRKDANRELKEALPDRNLRIALLEVIGDDPPLVQQDVVTRLEEFLKKEGVTQNEIRDDKKIADWAERIEAFKNQAKLEKSQRYSQLESVEKSARAARLGINEHAQPDVGESFAALSTRTRILPEDKEKWNVHFAPVVARVGDDTITLENYAREGDGVDRYDRWFFNMHGPKERSFHEEYHNWVADGVTLRMGEAATPEMREEFKRSIREKVGELSPQLQARIDSATTRAELAAIYAAAT